MKDAERKICVGQFAGAHGVRGVVKLRSFTEDPEAIFDYEPLAAEDGRIFKITFKSAAGAQSRLGPVSGHGAGSAQSSRAQTKAYHFLVDVDGVDSKEAADALRGDRLYVPRSKMPKTRKGEYYEAELMGLTAYDESGKEFGKILGVHDHGAGSFIEIGHSRKDSFMLPFKDAFVPEVDITGGRVVIIVPEGWP